jgi:Cellulose binding domain
VHGFRPGFYSGTEFASSDQKITSAWNATVSQSGEAVTAVNASYDAAIGPGGSASIGFQGTWTSNDNAPSSFTLNGVACT